MLAFLKQWQNLHSELTGFKQRYYLNSNMIHTPEAPEVQALGC